MKTWKPSEINFLKINFLNKGAKYCANYLNRTTLSIYHKTEKLGLLKEKRKVNIDKFNRIKIPEISYFLGMLWADGCVHNYEISLGLTYKDMKEIEYILKSFADWYFCKRNPPRGTSWKPTFCARICNRQLREFLINNDYKIKSQKSPAKILSKIPIKLHCYFWRGFLDGDGCIYVQKNKNWKFGSITFAGSFEQDWSELESLLSKMKIKYKLSRIRSIETDHKSSKIVISNLDDIIILGDYLYKNRNVDKIGLQRKFNKYQILKKYLKNRELNIR